MADAPKDPPHDASDDPLERERTVALAVAGAIATVVPPLHEINRRASAKMSRALWPRGAPRRVTWKDVLAANAGILERSMSEIVAKDMRTHGGTVRPETATRVRMTEDVLAKYRSAKVHFQLDDMLERVTPAGEPRHLGGLLDASLFVVMRTASVIVERDGRRGTLELARLSVPLLEEILRGLGTGMRALGWDAETEALARMDEGLGRVREALAAMPTSAEIPEPVTLGSEQAALAPDRPTSSSDAEPQDPQVITSRLARLASGIEQAAAVIAAGIDRVLFAGTPPERVSWLVVHEAVAELSGHPLAAPGRARDGIARCDEIVMPDEGQPFSTRQLVEASGHALAWAAQRLREVDDEERSASAQAVWLQSKLIALEVVVAAQVSGNQLLVAPLAADIGLSALPFPDQAKPRGSA